MSDRRKTQYVCLKCTSRQFKGIRLIQNHIKSYHKVKGREATNQFFIEWIIKPVPIM
jgi:hypothetical protein